MDVENTPDFHTPDRKGSEEPKATGRKGKSLSRNSSASISWLDSNFASVSSSMTSDHSLYLSCKNDSRLVTPCQSLQELESLFGNASGNDTSVFATLNSHNLSMMRQSGMSHPQIKTVFSEASNTSVNRTETESSISADDSCVGEVKKFYPTHNETYAEYVFR